MRSVAVYLSIITLSSLPAVCQQPAPSPTVPIYHVTVIERNLQAINYQYRSGPTEIEFRGTVLLPKGKGHATVESHRGRTQIDAKLENLTAPQDYGREYLTYVLWAISPEGAPHNICELVPGSSNVAKVHVTTELQAFGLMVTAEPYAAVKQPSDVVVMENQVLPETIGRTEPIIAKTELLPRGHYTLDVQAKQARAAEAGPKVSMDEYEQLSQIYQAQNALQMARTANADTLASDTFARAQQMLNEAERLRATKAGTSLVVQSARAASQTFDDARAIAQKRAQDMKIADAQDQAEAARRQAARAQADADQARAQLEAARVQAENQQPVVAQSTVTEQRVERAPELIPPPPERHDNMAQMQFRSSLLRQLNGVIATHDTPRGLVVTIPGADFRGAELLPGVAAQLSRIAPLLAQPGLSIAVEGHVDANSAPVLASERAEAVRSALGSRGQISAAGFGSSRPTASNSTEGGRVENRRVEIVISGDPIGASPLWNRSYSVTMR